MYNWARAWSCLTQMDWIESLHRCKAISSWPEPNPTALVAVKYIIWMLHAQQACTFVTTLQHTIVLWSSVHGAGSRAHIFEEASNMMCMSLNVLSVLNTWLDIATQLPNSSFAMHWVEPFNHQPYGNATLHDYWQTAFEGFFNCTFVWNFLKPSIAPSCRWMSRLNITRCNTDRDTLIVHDSMHNKCMHEWLFEQSDMPWRELAT